MEPDVAKTKPVVRFVQPRYLYEMFMVFTFGEIWRYTW